MIDVSFKLLCTEQIYFSFTGSPNQLFFLFTTSAKKSRIWFEKLWVGGMKNFEFPWIPPTPKKINSEREEIIVHDLKENLISSIKKQLLSLRTVYAPYMAKKFTGCCICIQGAILFCIFNFKKWTIWLWMHHLSYTNLIQ